METLKYIRQLHHEGKGIKTITDILEKRKRPSPKGREWNPIRFSTVTAAKRPPHQALPGDVCGSR
jgi:hypothetical protein